MLDNDASRLCINQYLAINKSVIKCRAFDPDNMKCNTDTTPNEKVEHPNRAVDSFHVG